MGLDGIRLQKSMRWEKDEHPDLDPERAWKKVLVREGRVDWNRDR